MCICARGGNLSENVLLDLAGGRDLGHATDAGGDRNSDTGEEGAKEGGREGQGKIDLKTSSLASYPVPSLDLLSALYTARTPLLIQMLATNLC